jgi:flagellar biosynthesis/type III secretory pathway protein FliH
VKRPPAIRRALSESEEKGHVEGKAEGRREGKAEGRREGKAEGRTEGKAEAVLAVLEARGVKVTSALRKRILAATGAAEVDTWLRRAAVVQKAKELFGERP